MKVRFVECVCENCSKVFSRPALSDFAYGEFLLWTHGGSVAYLNVFLDASYDEVRNIIARLNLKEETESGKSLVQIIYGEVACDPDESGCPFSIVANPPCPGCGKVEFLSCSPVVAGDLNEAEVPAVTHNGWEALADDEKEAIVLKIAAKCGGFR